MLSLKIAIFIFLSSITGFAVAGNLDAGDSQPSHKALQLINSLGLREGGQALRDHPRWQKPDYIVAIIPPQFKPIAATMISALKESAGDIEIREYTPSKEALPAYVKNATVVFGACNKALVEQIPNLMWIQINSSGSESCTSQAGVTSGDFILTNAQKMGAVPIAEHAISLTLMLNRNLHYYHRNQIAGNWVRQLKNAPSVGELSEKTLLVLGLGGIGTEVAKRAHALGMRVIATRNSSRTGPDYVAKVGLASDMLQLANEADFVVNALPLTPKTTHLIDEKFFSALKKGSYYISVGRGKTTNLDDLMQALNNGKLAGAALDVTDPEPLPENHPLWKMDNVIITPHIAGYSMAAIRRSFVLYAENLRRYLNGEKLLNVVDIKRGY